VRGVPTRPIPPIRIGWGYDIHRLEPTPPRGSGRPFLLGGVEIEHDRGPIGQTDADTLLHAITDALLGAMGMPNMGTLFQKEDHHAQDSRIYLDEACRRMRDAGWEIGNLDATIILERPRIAAHKGEICRSVAKCLRVPQGRVNVKSKTHEGLDAIGKGRGVEVQVCVLLHYVGLSATRRVGRHKGGYL